MTKFKFVSKANASHECFKWIQTIYGSLFSYSHGKFELTHNSLNFIWKHLHILSIKNTPCWSVLPFNAIPPLKQWKFCIANDEFTIKNAIYALDIDKWETNGRRFDKLCFLTQFISRSKFKLCINLTLRSITAKYSKKYKASTQLQKIRHTILELIFWFFLVY